MPLLAIGAIAAALASVGAAGISAASQMAGLSEANRLRVQASQEYGIPLDQIDQILESHFNVPQSQLAQLKEDPGLRDTQMKALADMEGIVDNKGMDAQGRNALYQANNAAQQQFAGNAGAIQRQVAQSGMANSPIGFALQEQAASDAANNAGNMGMQGAAQASNRYLQALSQMGSYASGIRGQDFSINSAKAQAQDELNRQNAAMSFNVAQMNRDAINSNNATKEWGATGRANALTGNAAALDQQSQRTGQMINNIGAGVATGVGYGAQAISNGGWGDNSQNNSGGQSNDWQQVYRKPY